MTSRKIQENVATSSSFHTDLSLNCQDGGGEGKRKIKNTYDFNLSCFDKSIYRGVKNDACAQSGRLITLFFASTRLKLVLSIPEKTLVKNGTTSAYRNFKVAFDFRVFPLPHKFTYRRINQLRY